MMIRTDDKIWFKYYVKFYQIMIPEYLKEMKFSQIEMSHRIQDPILDQLLEFKRNQLKLHLQKF